MKRLQRGGMSAAVIAFVFWGGSAGAQKETKAKDHEGHMEHMAAMKECAKACSDCQGECDSCVTHCAHMVKEGKKEHWATLRTCQDCADFCATASRIVARGGPFAGICHSCAEACARCAKECEKFADDAHMKRCAEECRKCEKACKAMTTHVGHPVSK